MKGYKEVVNNKEYYIYHCTQDHITGNDCMGKRKKDNYGNPITNQGWIFKIEPGKMYNIHHFVQGKDIIDLRNQHITCDDLEVFQSNHLEVKSPNKDNVVHLRFILETFDLSCADFLFANDDYQIVVRQSDNGWDLH